MTEDELHQHLRVGGWPLPGDEAFEPPVAGVHGCVDYIYIPLPAVGDRCGQADPLTGLTCDQTPLHLQRHVARTEDQTWLWPVMSPTR